MTSFCFFVLLLKEAQRVVVVGIEMAMLRMGVYCH